MPRLPDDPKAAFLLEVKCAECSSGDKVSECFYYDERGADVDAA